MNHEKQERIMKITILISGYLTVTIAGLSVFDILLFNGWLGFSSWGGNQVMALPTSACFILLGSAFILRGILIKSIADKVEKR